MTLHHLSELSIYFEGEDHAIRNKLTYGKSMGYVFMCVPVATKGSSFIVKTRKRLQKIFLKNGFLSAG
jgi:hypothetical protein